MSLMASSDPSRDPLHSPMRHMPTSYSSSQDYAPMPPAQPARHSLPSLPQTIFNSMQRSASLPQQQHTVQAPYQPAYQVDASQSFLAPQSTSGAYPPSSFHAPPPRNAQPPPRYAWVTPPTADVPSPVRPVPGRTMPMAQQPSSMFTPTHPEMRYASQTNYQQRQQIIPPDQGHRKLPPLNIPGTPLHVPDLGGTMPSAWRPPSDAHAQLGAESPSHALSSPSYPEPDYASDTSMQGLRGRHAFSTVPSLSPGLPADDSWKWEGGYAVPPSVHSHSQYPLASSDSLTSHLVSPYYKTNATARLATGRYSSVPAAPTPTTNPRSESAEEQQPTTAAIKKKRKRADANQLRVLNAVYSRTAFPSTEERHELARQLDMQPRSVQIWFQNKRQSARSSRSASNSLPPIIHIGFNSDAGSLNSGGADPSSSYGNMDSSLYMPPDHSPTYRRLSDSSSPDPTPIYSTSTDTGDLDASGAALPSFPQVVDSVRRGRPRRQPTH